MVFSSSMTSSLGDSANNMLFLLLVDFKLDRLDPVKLSFSPGCS
jgi:hypothetical protein